VTVEQASKPSETSEQRPPHPVAVSVSASAEVKVSEQVEVDGGTGGVNQVNNNEEQVAQQNPSQNSGELVGNNQSSG
jgi:hypothetical protein